MCLLQYRNSSIRELSLFKQRFKVAAILLVLLVRGVGCGDEPTLIDQAVLADITGTWRVVTGLADGQELSKETLRQSYVFVDDKFSVVVGEQSFLTAKIHQLSHFDRDYEPVVEIDFSNVDQTESLDRVKGLLELQGDMMILCTAKVGKVRPAAFSSRLLNGCSLLVMQRVRNPAETYGNVDDASKNIAEKLLTELLSGIVQSPSESRGPSDTNEQINGVDKVLLANIQGTWKSVSFHYNGQDSSEAIPPLSYAIEVEGDRYLPIAKHRIVGNLKVSRLVKLNDYLEIDIIQDDPQKKPSHAKAIIRLEDDALTLCADLIKGGDRPDEFVTRPNSRLVLFVLRRITVTNELIFKPRRRLMGQKP